MEKKGKGRRSEREAVCLERGGGGVISIKGWEEGEMDSRLLSPPLFAIPFEREERREKRAVIEYHADGGKRKREGKWSRGKKRMPSPSFLLFGKEKIEAEE